METRPRTEGSSGKIGGLVGPEGRGGFRASSVGTAGGEVVSWTSRGLSQKVQELWISRQHVLHTLWLFSEYPIEERVLYMQIIC